MDLFNMEFNELAIEAQDDPELAVRYLLALVMAVDHAVRDLARTTGLSHAHADIVRHILPDRLPPDHMN